MGDERSNEGKRARDPLFRRQIHHGRGTCFFGGRHRFVCVPPPPPPLRCSIPQCHCCCLLPSQLLRLALRFLSAIPLSDRERPAREGRTQERERGLRRRNGICPPRSAKQLSKKAVGHESCGRHSVMISPLEIRQGRRGGLPNPGLSGWLFALETGVSMTWSDLYFLLKFPRS